MFKKLSLSIVCICILTTLSFAAPITAYEFIDDAQRFELTSRNLERTRSSSTGYFNSTTSDSTIISENLVNAAFGIWNNDDVSYRHDLTWLDPAAASYMNASLTVYSYGVDGNDDKVYADSFYFGNLVSDGSILEGFTTSVFSSSNSLFLNAVLADGFLNVFINKNAGALFGGLDKLSVYGSKLEVTYEPVPEPATMLLLGSGLVVALRKRRAALN